MRTTRNEVRLGKLPRPTGWQPVLPMRKPTRHSLINVEIVGGDDLAGVVLAHLLQ